MDDPDEVHRAYRRLVKQWHPDQFTRQPDIRSLAEERLKQINQAYSILNKNFTKIRSTDRNNSKKTKNSIIAGQKRNSPDKGIYSSWKQWFNTTIVKNRSNDNSSPSPEFSPKAHRTAEKNNRSGFESILRQTRSGKKVHSSSGISQNRRTAPIFRYRRGSGGTRIQGNRPVSPIRPIRPVSGIAPIDGSD